MPTTCQMVPSIYFNCPQKVKGKNTFYGDKNHPKKYPTLEFLGGDVEEKEFFFTISHTATKSIIIGLVLPIMTKISSRAQIQEKQHIMAI